MIGSGLKKFANENGLIVSNGVAYGNLRGYAVTLSEGNGYKQMVFSTQFFDPVKKTEFTDAISQVGNKALYDSFRVNNLGIDAKTIRVVFRDSVGTMDKLRAFVDWFLPYLRAYGASVFDACTVCGGQVTNGNWVMVDGVCHYVHSTCADRLANDVNSYNDNQKQSREGSYLSGGIGAFVGAALGAIVWAIVLMGGYVASIVGLLIGWLADKGYSLLKGKQGKAKVVILILAVIFGVLLGTLAADVFTIVNMINNDELYGVTYSDIPELMSILFENEEYVSTTAENVIMGLVFAGIGVFAMLYRAGKEVADVKFKKLS